MALPPTAGAVLHWPYKRPVGESEMMQPRSPHRISDVWSIFMRASPRATRHDGAVGVDAKNCQCSGCDEVLRVIRSMGCDTSVNASRMAYDDAATAADAAALGPDDISVWLEGAELLSPLGVVHSAAVQMNRCGTLAKRLGVQAGQAQWRRLCRGQRPAVRGSKLTYLVVGDVCQW